MKAIDLYKLEAESETTCLGVLKGFYYDHLPEVEDHLWGYESSNEKIIIKTLKDFDFDGRRRWTLRTIWFEGNPVMITQNAGREGDDHRERYITNINMYTEMVNYIKSLTGCEGLSDDCCIDEYRDYDFLDTFYGNTLNGKFEKY